MDVAAQIIPQASTLNHYPAQTALTYWNKIYEYDLLSPKKLLDKYVGKSLKLIQETLIRTRKRR
jgi:hypothetical protein